MNTVVERVLRGFFRIVTMLILFVVICFVSLAGKWLVDTYTVPVVALAGIAVFVVVCYAVGDEMEDRPADADDFNK
jgi:amino acid permease